MCDQVYEILPRYETFAYSPTMYENQTTTIAPPEHEMLAMNEIFANAPAMYEIFAYSPTMYETLAYPPTKYENQNTTIAPP